MNRRHLVFITAAGCGLLVILFCMALLVPSHPIALIKVLDMAGKPVAGAVVQADGLRPKAGHSGHYTWMSERLGVRNDPVVTDKEGLAAIPYPKYITERIE